KSDVSTRGIYNIWIDEGRNFIWCL
uniref:DNA-binding response regulator n=1 Tax=Strongyloides venezuelensis TaxID=75913 RepID=A0A0K0G652_STRVS